VAVEAYRTRSSFRFRVLTRRIFRTPRQTGGFRLPFRQESVTASLAAQADGLAYDKHLAGGMLAWKAAGLPTRTG